jgi:hypothetical protein
MLVFEAPHIRIHWDEEAHCVRMEWCAFASGQAFRDALDRGLALLQEQQAAYWLADLRELGVVTAEDQAWSNNDWFPRALQTTMTHMAIVMPKKVIAKWSVDRIMQKLEGVNLTVHYFGSVQEAKAWFNVDLGKQIS